MERRRPGGITQRPLWSAVGSAARSPGATVKRSQPSHVHLLRPEGPAQQSPGQRPG